MAGRVVLGLILFGAYASALPHVQSLYGPQGLGGRALHDRVPGLTAGRALEQPAALLHLVASPELVWLLYGVLLVASLAFAAGAFTRSCGVVALVLHTLFHARNFTATLGWAVMLKPFLAIVILAPAARYASLDAWRQRGRGVGTPAAEWIGPGWALRLIQMQVCAMYAVNWLRLDDPGWRGGAMVFTAVRDRWYGRLDVDWYPLVGLLGVLTLASLVLELLSPVALWLPGIGRFWALGLIGLHLSLELFTNVGWWQPLMLAMLLTFLPASWLAPPIDWLRRFVVVAPSRWAREVFG